MKSCEKISQQQFLGDQERIILEEIHSLNKKLTLNNHSSQAKQNHLFLKQQHSKDQEKYFSQQCDQLFNQPPGQKQFQDDSLFNSNQDMLIGNSFQKQLKHFDKFDTNQFASIPNHNPEPCRKSSNPRNQQARRQKPKPPYANDTQNKQNASCSSNLFPQKSYIKQVKNKMRLKTQSDAKIYNPNHHRSSEKYQAKNEFMELTKQAWRDKQKYKQESMHYTFKPSILKKSNQIAENLAPSFQRLTQDISVSKNESKLPYQPKETLCRQKYSVERLQRLSQPRKVKQQTSQEEPSYSFQPTLSKKSLSQMANCTLDVASRNRIWQEQKEQKIKKLKCEEEERKNKIQSGPFVPQINVYKPQNPVHLSRFAKQGISNYFERISMVKQKNEPLSKSKAPIEQKPKPQQSQARMKAKTYDEAVKQLHKKILTMNI